MKELNLFYQFYDLLYSDKDYKSEIETILSIAKKFTPLPLNKILEIGCGTGNHTNELADHGIEITAIDTDKSMVGLAIAKGIGNPNWKVRFCHHSVEQLSESDFNMAIALFNVVSYIPDTAALQSFFNGVYKALLPGGVFIFDCWNGIAAIKDPPQGKSISKTSMANLVRCDLISHTDFYNQKSRLEYSIKVRDNENNTYQSDVFELEQTLWTPMQIKDCIENSKLKMVHSCKSFEIEKPATDHEWKIMFICKK